MLWWWWWWLGGQKGQFTVGPQSASPANIYICGTFYYTLTVFKATQFILPCSWAPHHGCTWAPLVLHTVYSACVSQSVKCETLSKVCILYSSITTPVVAMLTSCACVYYYRCNCFAVKPHCGGSHISSLAYECEQAISVGLL